MGTYQPTFQSAVWNGKSLKPITTYKGKEMLGGDSTVPAFSATPIELSNAKNEIFAACPHAGLQNFDPVRVQVRAQLADIDISEIKAPSAEPISLDLADGFFSGERFSALACCPSALDPMRATLTNIATGTEIDSSFELTPDIEWQSLTVPCLAPGTYRIRIEAGESAEPITDVFAVYE